MPNIETGYHNGLNSISFKNFDKVELDLFFTICVLVKENKWKETSHTFEDLHDFLNYSGDSLDKFIDYLDSIYRKMLALTYNEISEDRLDRVQLVLFNRFEIDGKKQSVVIQISDQFEYILRKFASDFTVSEIKEFIGLRSAHSKVLYQLLKQHRDKGQCLLDVTDLKLLLDVPSSDSITVINKRVLEPCIEELASYFENLKFNKIRGNKGNKITHIEFSFQDNIHEADNEYKVVLHRKGYFYTKKAKGSTEENTDNPILNP